MNATQLAPRRTQKTHQVPARPVTEILLEIAYYLHGRKAVVRASAVTSLNVPVGGFPTSASGRKNRVG